MKVFNLGGPEAWSAGPGSVQVREEQTGGADLEGARTGAGGARGGGQGGGGLQGGGVLGDGGAKKRQAVRGLAGPAGLLEAGVAGQGGRVVGGGGQGGRGGATLRSSTAGRSGRCWVSRASSRPGQGERFNYLLEERGL